MRFKRGQEVIVRRYVGAFYEWWRLETITAVRNGTAFIHGDRFDAITGQHLDSPRARIDVPTEEERATWSLQQRVERLRVRAEQTIRRSIQGAIELPHEKLDEIERLLGAIEAIIQGG